MNRKLGILVFCLSAPVLTIFGCTKQESEERRGENERSALQEYVRNPIEQAQDAREAVEEHDRAMREALDSQ